MQTFTSIKHGRIESDLTTEAAQARLKAIFQKDRNEFVGKMAHLLRPIGEQLFWIHKLAVDSMKERATIQVGEFEKLTTLFKAAGKNLKKPKLTFQNEVGIITISLAGSSSANVDHLYVKCDNEYQGKITPAGQFLGISSCKQEIRELLANFNADILGFAVAYGKKTGNCCCCGRFLENPESVALGIGPICRQKWGM